MHIFVTGVGGQLGHDVINELCKRGHTGIGSDIAPAYSGVQDGSAVTTAPYFPMDITDSASVEQVIGQVKPDVVVRGRSIWVVSPVIIILEPMPRRVKNILIWCVVVFCASSSTIMASLSVRPRINASGAI